MQIKINIVDAILIISLLIVLFNRALNFTEFCYFVAISLVIARITTQIFDIVLYLANKKNK